MGLRLYNTLTRTKEDFRPIDAGNIRMYVCGPTVYDFAHIGNARPLIVFDVLFRLLRHLYDPGHVTYIRNITDVDDKINARAAEEYPELPLNEAIRAVTTKTEKQFREDVAALGCLEPTREPRATEHIAEMKAMIEALIERGCAYVAEDHVLFHVAAMKDYGRLSNRSLDEMIAGARVEVAPYKKEPTDFVLWKPSKPGEPAWPSPAGIAAPGRPGWHLECSAMSDRWLWQEARAGLSQEGLAHPHEFDIHGGGIDLVFPHHENEIAQSRCAFGTKVMANYWLHNGFLQVEGEKMSKSLGNFVTIRELLREWTGPVVRFAMLQTHYRQPINWTVDRLEKSRSEIGTWAGLFYGSEAQDDFVQRRLRKEPPKPTPALVEALSDDLNTSLAVTLLREQFSSSSSNGLSREFFQNCEFLGLLDGAKIGALEDTRVSGSVVPKVLFESMPAVLQARAGIANNDPELVEKARAAVRALGAELKVGKDAFVELVPVTEGDALDSEKVEALVAARAAARERKDYAEADRIRAELDAMGIALKDSKDPKTGELVTTWEVKR